MKLTKCASLLAIGLVLSLAATGCKSKKNDVTPLRPGGEVPTISGRGDLDQAGRFGMTDNNGGVGSNALPGGGDAATFDPDQMDQDRSAFALQTVYFGYDSSSISSSEQSKIEVIASALQADPSAKLLIEGNCDERGTEEYNRSLGERRALAAREALAALGIDPARVATRSYGEDRPADEGHDQAAWSRNRRDEFVLLHPR
ncbi:MAG TPA: OmpA family protein [Verrucomicrobiae bacterium]|jgi:peptidoglycan-associated lipoprotein|nr:OmpA family protein [Verrucomicrobiae bacterium]